MQNNLLYIAITTRGNIQRKLIVASYAYSYSYQPIIRKYMHVTITIRLFMVLYKAPRFHGMGVSANVFINK